MRVTPDATLIYPLDEFYEKAGLPLPPMTTVSASEVPEPYRGLLVHPRDMTPTLENAYGRNIHLRVLERTLAGNVLSREVVLVPEGGSAPVAFGVIKINLEHFSEPARALVLEGQEPLGAILRGQAIAHTSHPNPYFRVTADPLMRKALHLVETCVLYGRRNVILDGAGRTLAQVVEILPPANGLGHI
ncbi:MAG TPA: hypothetical protein VK335_00290 [Bryobacteraceae bacterium]|nr:hypothetical protein [Bryobacteraceae bacterium]